MKNFYELRQTGENTWTGRYNGNYGNYTVKVTLKGGKAVKYSCSCPSDYYPCKHIGYIENAIAERTAKSGESSEVPNLEELIKNISTEKLRHFILAKIKYDNELRNEFLLEFASGAGDVNGNTYSGIIRNVLGSIPDIDDYYDYDGYLELDALDQWFDKARDLIKNEQYDDAILICQACIEEYSQWLYNAGEDVSDLYDSDYQTIPFDIIDEAAEFTDQDKLFNYCFSEMGKEKYKGTEFYTCFHNLLETISLTVDPDAYIALQDKLLSETGNLRSIQAESILRRKIDFYRRLNKPAKAWALIEQNLQICSFRLELTEKKIKERKYSEAKKLINDYLSEQKNNESQYLNDTWQNLLLEIAQKENDKKAIRELSFGFIKEHFRTEYYKIYKSTFAAAEWKDEMEKLLLLYDQRKRYNSSVADLLVAEKEAKRLLLYIEKHLSVDILGHYYNAIASDYPEQTLELFNRVLVSYAERNIGRRHYDFILSMLKKMAKIKNGKMAAQVLVDDFKVRYKNRKAMIEVLNSF